MNQRYKLVTILGTRPEIIRLSAVIKACDKYFDHKLVHTGQNWDPKLSDIFFSDLDLRAPDEFFQAAGESLGQTMGRIIERSYTFLSKERPHALLVLGDTNSALSVISAKRLKIPIFHMEAGNRCFDLNVPEEINRRLVDHVSDINLPYTEHGRRYLLSEGIPKQNIFVTGSPMPEVLFASQEKIKRSQILEELGLTPQKYFVVSAHREENIDIVEKFNSLIESINAVAEFYDLPIIFSTHPRTAIKLKSSSKKLHPHIRNIEPFSFSDYNQLQVNAKCVLSDSGTLSEESSILSFPGVLLRTSTERPETLDVGQMVISGISPRGVINAIEVAEKTFCRRDRDVRKPFDYQDKNVSEKVVKIIASYINIVRKETWDLAPVE